VERVLKRQARKLASRVLSQKERPALDRSADTNASEGLAVKKVCSLISLHVS